MSHAVYYMISHLPRAIAGLEYEGVSEALLRNFLLEPYVALACSTLRACEHEFDKKLSSTQRTCYATAWHRDVTQGLEWGESQVGARVGRLVTTLTAKYGGSGKATPNTTPSQGNLGVTSQAQNTTGSSDRSPRAPARCPVYHLPPRTRSAPSASAAPLRLARPRTWVLRIWQRRAAGRRHLAMGLKPTDNRQLPVSTPPSPSLKPVIPETPRPGTTARRVTCFGPLALQELPREALGLV